MAKNIKIIIPRTVLEIPANAAIFVTTTFLGFSLGPGIPSVTSKAMLSIHLKLYKQLPEDCKRTIRESFAKFEKNQPEIQNEVQNFYDQLAEKIKKITKS